MMAFGGNKEGALSGQKNFKQYLRSYALVIIFLGVCAVFAIASPTFLQPTNIVGVFRQIAINGVLALGMTLVIITGGIDLSVGSLMAITGVVSAMILENNPNMLAVALIVGIGAAALMSMWTAVLVAKMRIAAFIASLSTMTIARGVALVVADGIPHTIKDTAYSEIGNGYLWDPAATGGVGFPVLVLILIVVAVITAVILYNTKFGRYIYAVGGNENAAEASGVNVVKVKFWTYVLNGALCGVAGMMLAARITSGQPNAATGYELDAITAVIIGGTSMAGGSGKISGTIIGALIIGVLNNGLVLLGVSSYYQQIIKGIIIAVAVLLDMKTKKGN
ncbi:ABC transporter permease [Christensenella intestinihominis]|uniref:ABC transporter permease n=1 Tax=Christensenella intestinihominis TaxID=1851429 RepID=UPI000B0631E3|nr:ABC transporter permease [Christensenella intestinihominis]